MNLFFSLIVSACVMVTVQEHLHGLTICCSTTSSCYREHILDFITLDCYVAICYPFWYHRHVTCKGYLKFIVLIPLTLTIYPAISAMSKVQKCYDIESSAGIALAAVTAITFLVILMYCRIYKVAKVQTFKMIKISTLGENTTNERKLLQSELYWEYGLHLICHWSESCFSL